MSVLRGGRKENIESLHTDWEERGGNSSSCFFYIRKKKKRRNKTPFAARKKKGEKSRDHWSYSEKARKGGGRPLRRKEHPRKNHSIL